VKVATADGAVDVSQVMAALDWVVGHRNDDPRNPIKVISLAYGTDGVQSSQVDPLAHAVENAWRAGITVVVAGGNDGSDARLVNPATDPYVIAVGALDTRNNTNAADDSYASFTSRGDATRRLDLLAPGRSIVSLRAPGSLADSYQAARVGTRFFKGSGSSQAAVVVSGVVAQLLQARPSFTPDQVKRQLIRTASGPMVADSLDAAFSPLASGSAQTWPRSTGTGGLEAARGSIHLSDGENLLTGENDLFGPFDTVDWAAASSAQTAWNGGSWRGRELTGTSWITSG
jgi:serine protease AprX